MADNVYYGNEMSLTVKTSSGTSLSVGVLKDVSIIPGVEVDELYGADSIKRQSVKQREFSVQVTVGVASYDVTMIQEWLGGSGSSSTSIVDTADPAQFNVIGQVTPDGGSTDLKGDVSGVVFPEMPVFEASEGEFVTENIEGMGKNVTVTGP